jgi:signal transduction histidine kinase
MTAGAFAMGSGIFSMHFIGMLAFILPLPVSYDFFLTLLSLLIAICASAFAFFLIQRPHLYRRRIVLGGCVLGLAITGMHYTGMAAMRGVHMSYHPGLYLLSVLIGVVASIAALALMIFCEEERGGKKPLYKACSALIMGVAICGLHYTAQAATIFVPSAEPAQLPFLLPPGALALLISFVASSIMLVTLIAEGYRHLVLAKLLLGSGVVILLIIPACFFVLHHLNAARHALDVLIRGQEIYASGEVARIAQQLETTVHIILFLTGTIILAILSIGLILALQISRPILRLRDVANAVGRGDLAARARIDTTDEIGQLAHSFNTMVNELTEANRRGDAFLGIAAHDLRHPLSTIIEGIALLGSGVFGKLNNEQEHMAGVIHKAGNSMLRLLNELLSVHSLTTRSFTIVPKETRLSQFAQEIFSFNQPIAEKKQIAFRLHTDIHTDKVYFDVDKIAQVVNNFLSNAFKFSLPDSHVSLSVQSHGATIRIEVSDEAGGIPEKEQDRIFTKFSHLTKKPTAGEDSHGLGLSICKEIIDAHKGEIGFVSTPGKGSVFYIQLTSGTVF